MNESELIQKYDVPGPRYTSYPTVPYWETDAFSTDLWKQRLHQQVQLSGGQVSLYIHLPYCESLCTFCGCHKRITKNHSVEKSYLEAVLKEWQLYQDLLLERPRIAEIHLGGGTPTFFAAENLRWFLEQLLAGGQRAEHLDFGFEGHPNNTTAEHLSVLHALGFRRVSFGVQDYDPRVQRAIHRIQPFANVEQVMRQSREIGYTSVSHDLVYGLPFQTIETVEDTIRKTIQLQPDRISYYSYAHVPWIKGTGQRGFHDEDIPKGAEKRALYERGRALLHEAGYTEIGMDHFALPHDSLYQAMNEGRLHRNFMGYTTTRSDVLIGLGASSISDCWTAFAQNEKDIDAYMDQVSQGALPILKGHALTERDLGVRQQILNLMCRFETDWTPHSLEIIDDFSRDGLLTYTNTRMVITELGRPFIRNICMALDEKLNQTPLTKSLFSKTI